MHSYRNEKFRFYLALFVALVPVLLFAQPDPNQTDAAGKKQGPWKKYSDGVLKYEGQFKDDKPTGKFTYYYPSGTVKSVSVYSANGTICRTKNYHEENGKLMAEGKYINEQKDSVWNYYSFDDKLMSTEKYAKGLKEGAWKTFYPDSTHSLLEIKNYKADVLDGAWEQYFQNSKLKTKATYIKGKLEGMAIYYQSDGNKLMEGKFKNGLREGAWYSYTAEGKFEKAEKYSKGELVDGPKLDKVDKNKGGNRPPAKEED